MNTSLALSVKAQHSDISADFTAELLHWNTSDCTSVPDDVVGIDVRVYVRGQVR